MWPSELGGSWLTTNLRTEAGRKSVGPQNEGLAITLWGPDHKNALLLLSGCKSHLTG